MMASVVLLLGAAVVTAAREGCTEELTSFSPCLAYVSYPPNNLTESASEKCCEAFSSAADSACLCYLLREPMILGFPLNSSRLLSLSWLCPSPNTTSTTFPSLCSASAPALPPLNSAPTQPLRGSGGGGGGGRLGGSYGKGVPAEAGAGAGAATITWFHNTSPNASTLTSHILLFITLIFSTFSWEI
uniref:Bifunctional inhibitor/plant lipid transfer protein/seed storage helical domain-containing protein n=1 Tax=Cajanus cajan TaxID=3821 RepID=A0A151SD73_CAJCA|nr:hypothetical protein KK1_025472 [Cajanus cajan]